MTRKFFFIDTMCHYRDRDNYDDDKLKHRMMFYGTQEEAEAYIKAENEKLEVVPETRKQAEIRELNREIKSLERQIAATEDIDTANLQALGIYPVSLRKELDGTKKDLEKVQKKNLHFWRREGDMYLCFCEMDDFSFNWGINPEGRIETYEPGTTTSDPSEY